MNKTYAHWNTQLDDFEKALEGLNALGESVTLWSAFSPAVTALYQAVLRERDDYQVTAGRLRGWLLAHEKNDGRAEELAGLLRDTVFSSRRLKGLIDAFNREKAVAEAAYPELAGGSLKDTPVAGLEPRALADKGDKTDKGDKGDAKAPERNAPKNVTEAKPS